MLMVTRQLGGEEAMVGRSRALHEIQGNVGNHVTPMVPISPRVAETRQQSQTSEAGQTLFLLHHNLRMRVGGEMDGFSSSVPVERGLKRSMDLVAGNWGSNSGLQQQISTQRQMNAHRSLDGSNMALVHYSAGAQPKSRFAQMIQASQDGGHRAADSGRPVSRAKFPFSEQRFSGSGSMLRVFSSAAAGSRTPPASPLHIVSSNPLRSGGEARRAPDWPGVKPAGTTLMVASQHDNHAVIIGTSSEASGEIDSVPRSMILPGSFARQSSDSALVIVPLQDKVIRLCIISFVCILHPRN